ncbi:hypothetical protein PF005_g12383 [Phytophthora fragariae]|uniref:Rab-GAP TBC domain-containing protein n=1 Tax=Phytophthora fragariae TaxID=53985 RepID=A0A6A3XTC2_9STRA|nr:hypothetical protein PF003_g19078 [Phytophthora fragariae]KAE8936331.1 hypothetical protein PF009_g13734 [Phytophthora fragariae]KAE9006964.1 hypothetical protein PF011_g11336 [Phytophthora fragariae]KAE9107936.1 hypothetical protein PF007_g12845 [Phytophthora fragariae]KAE9109189.1 hypothetical protein PF010_g11632 [Phytophthora fragariae]
MAALRYGEGMGLEERSLLLTERLAALDQVKEWKHLVKMELAQPEYPVDQVQSLRHSTTLENPLMYCLLEKMGLLGLVKRTVIDLHCEAMQSVAAASKKQVKRVSDDSRLLPGTSRSTNGCSLDVVRAARDNWERITSDEMLWVAKELGRPLIAPKVAAPSSGSEAAARDDEQMPPAADAESTKPAKANKTLAARFLYDGNDLLRSLQAIEPSNRVHEPTETATDAWGSIQLQLYSPPFPEYRRLFPELAPGCGQIGLDEHFPTQRSVFLAEKNRVGDLVLAHQSVSMARQYSKTGCPVSLRPQIWRQVLSVPVTAQDRSYFEHLKRQAAQWTYLTDDMYLLDLQQTIDSSDYFVFQDHLESVLIAFTRDTYVKSHALQVNGAVHCSLAGPGAPPSEFQPDETVNDTDSSVPPNGVLPFSGLVMYMAPLAYLYSDPVEIYFVFRELYARYWSKLNAIRTERGTILPLCKLFEDLVVRSSPAAVFHLINIGLKPLDIAFPWIQSAFSGTLDIDQVLLLWDRVIGYDSLELVAIFAAALFHFRASELESVSSREEADDLFAELIDIPVVTLLQDYLFELP